MKRTVPVKKNEEYIVHIVGMGYSGEGIGKIDDFTVFIKGAIKGEKVRVKLVKINKSFGFGKLIDIIEPSNSRVEPVCPIYKRCGGCQLQHISYADQLEFKKGRVEDCIERIGKLKDVTVNPVIGMNSREDMKPYRYRNKVQLPVGEKNGTTLIGFYSEGSHNIIDVRSCSIQCSIADDVVELTRKWMDAYKIKPYDEKIGNGIVRHIMIRHGFKTDETMVVIVTSCDELPYSNEFVQIMTQNIRGIKSIVQNVNRKKTNVVLGEKCINLWGEPFITEYIGKFKFNISPLSFFQVNPTQTEALYKKVLEFAQLKGDETVFDAYCGAGTISLFLSQSAKKVYGVEIVPEAIENAIQNARINGVDNVEFIVGKSEDMIPKLIDKGVKAQVVVVDPPRKGCDKKLLESISFMKPERIVYVSCDPATLARDLAILDSFGYKTLDVQPVDMFPQTAHIETVVFLS